MENNKFKKLILTPDTLAVILVANAIEDEENQKLLIEHYANVSTSFKPSGNSLPMVKVTDEKTRDFYTEYYDLADTDTVYEIKLSYEYTLGEGGKWIYCEPKTTTAKDNEEEDIFRQTVGQILNINSFKSQMFYAIITGVTSSDPNIAGLLIDWEYLHDLGITSMQHVNTKQPAYKSLFADFCVLWNSFRLATSTKDIMLINSVWRSLSQLSNYDNTLSKL